MNIEPFVSQLCSFHIAFGTTDSIVGGPFVYEVDFLVTDDYLCCESSLLVQIEIEFVGKFEDADDSIYYLAEGHADGKPATNTGDYMSYDFYIRINPNPAVDIGHASDESVLFRLYQPLRKYEKRAEIVSNFLFVLDGGGTIGSLESRYHSVLVASNPPVSRPYETVENCFKHIDVYGLNSQSVYIDVPEWDAGYDPRATLLAYFDVGGLTLGCIGCYEPFPISGSNKLPLRESSSVSTVHLPATSSDGYGNAFFEEYIAPSSGIGDTSDFDGIFFVMSVLREEGYDLYALCDFRIDPVVDISEFTQDASLSSIFSETSDFIEPFAVLARYSWFSGYYDMASTGDFLWELAFRFMESGSIGITEDFIWPVCTGLPPAVIPETLSGPHDLKVNDVVIADIDGITADLCGFTAVRVSANRDTEPFTYGTSLLSIRPVPVFVEYGISREIVFDPFPENAFEYARLFSMDAIVLEPYKAIVISPELIPTDSYTVSKSDFDSLFVDYEAYSDPKASSPALKISMSDNAMVVSDLYVYATAGGVKGYVGDIWLGDVADILGWYNSIPYRRASDILYTQQDGTYTWSDDTLAWALSVVSENAGNEIEKNGYYPYGILRIYSLESEDPSREYVKAGAATYFTYDGVKVFRDVSSPTPVNDVIRYRDIYYARVSDQKVVAEIVANGIGKLERSGVPISVDGGYVATSPWFMHSFLPDDSADLRYRADDGGTIRVRVDSIVGVYALAPYSGAFFDFGQYDEGVGSKMIGRRNAGGDVYEFAYLRIAEGDTLWGEYADTNPFEGVWLVLHVPVSTSDFMFPFGEAFQRLETIGELMEPMEYLVLDSDVSEDVYDFTLASISVPGDCGDIYEWMEYLLVRPDGVSREEEYVFAEMNIDNNVYSTKDYYDRWPSVWMQVYARSEADSASISVRTYDVTPVSGRFEVALNVSYEYVDDRIGKEARVVKRKEALPSAMLKYSEAERPGRYYEMKKSERCLSVYKALDYAGFDFVFDDDSLIIGNMTMSQRVDFYGPHVDVSTGVFIGNRYASDISILSNSAIDVVLSEVEKKSPDEFDIDKFNLTEEDFGAGVSEEAVRAANALIGSLKDRFKNKEAEYSTIEDAIRAHPELEAEIKQYLDDLRVIADTFRFKGFDGRKVIDGVLFKKKRVKQKFDIERRE